LVDGSNPSCVTRNWGISSFGRASDLHSEGERFDPAILHQGRLPLLNPEKLCGNNLQYISSHGKIQRPDVMYQGTLRKPLAFVAQLVEQWFEVPRVGGSNPSEGTMLQWWNGRHASLRN
jgi:hypothetical protein